MDYNPLDPDVTRDPYPYYAFLRREAPVHETTLGFAAVSRYDDVLHVLRAPDAFSSSAMADLLNGVKAMVSADLGGGETLLGTDPPVHTRMRKVVNRAFTPRRIAALEPRVRAIAAALAEDAVAKRTFDLMEDFAVPLPVMVIAEILGIDAERRADFKRWSDQLMSAMSGSPGPELRAALERSGAERIEYLEAVIAQRRSSPRDDVISALVRAEQDEDVLTEEEVGNFVVLLLVAGNETTTNLIGNALLALLEHPAALAGIRERPAGLPALLEEVLRYDSPVQLTLRRAVEDAELSGVKIRAGQTLGLLLGSANRDERQFPEADRFDAARSKPAHLSFGFGTHFCLGASLARLEARVALDALLSRSARLERLDAEVERAPSLLIRGPKSVRLRAVPAATGGRCA